MSVNPFFTLLVSDIPLLPFRQWQQGKHGAAHNLTLPISEQSFQQGIFTSVYPDRTDVSIEEAKYGRDGIFIKAVPIRGSLWREKWERRKERESIVQAQYNLLADNVHHATGTD